ncbi:N-acetylmuramoyl-L-alanine amidase [Virgibacillus proomii]|uniref:N-acetylmuramoyl-L-alanine amidase n=1 Tax=Virgibacillus proomii TaxID=84407 RepID=UPI001C11FFF7|nr:N-acetylmuramoyl-L-alanine amidase [Virgibacillus proomii]MBU5265802.1 N-acetylmuramoyl-L-alanine amidase [Virgibacillus proomii]
MKRTKIIVVLPIIIVFMLSFTPISHALEGIVTESRVNIHSGPGTQFSNIEQANKGDIYKVLLQADDWIKVKLKHREGWIAADYIQIHSEQPPETITISNKKTHIRNGPSTDYSINHFADEGSIYNVRSADGDWYEIENKHGRGYIYKQLTKPVNTPSQSSFANKTIVIDAGHGGRDVGAIGATEVFEKDVAYLTAQELKKELDMLGANVKMTRLGDDFISLNSRISFSNTLNTDVFISLHYNSVPQLPNVTGIEAYYYQRRNRSLATYVQAELIKSTGADNRGTSFGDFLVLRQNYKPAILVELGFISNKNKASLLQTTMYQQQLVSGIINGLGKYFANE